MNKALKMAKEEFEDDIMEVIEIFKVF